MNEGRITHVFDVGIGTRTSFNLIGGDKAISIGPMHASDNNSESESVGSAISLNEITSEMTKCRGVGQEGFCEFQCGQLSQFVSMVFVVNLGREARSRSRLVALGTRLLVQLTQGGIGEQLASTSPSP